MRKSHDGYQMVPFPRARSIVRTIARVARHKYIIRGLVEIDVTRARQSKWEHKDALNFLARYRAALTARPVAIFALGPFHAEEKEYQEVRRQLDKELAKFPWLTPAAIAIFGGKFDPEKLTFPHNLLPALKKMPASDIRDWTAIRAWANDLAAQFQPAMA